MAAIVLAIGGAAWYFLTIRKDYSLEGLAKAAVNYDCIDGFHDGLARVVKGEKYGFIDKMGNEVIPCIYYIHEGEYDYDFHDGLAFVYIGEKNYFINKDGKEAFPFNYDYADPFSEGLAYVSKDGHRAFIDTKGNEAFSLQDNFFPYFYSVFSEGMLVVKNDDKYGYIDKKGNLVIPPKFEYEDDEMSYMTHNPDFHEGFAVSYKNGKYGFIDKNGNEAIPYIYDRAMPFSDGMAIVMKNGKYGYVDKSGKEVIACTFDDAFSFSEGVAAVQEGDNYYVMDKSGKEVFSLSSYSKGYGLFSYHEGLATVYKSVGNGSSVSGFIDTSGKEVIPCIYTFCTQFSEGLAVVMKDGVYGFVDTKGNSTFDVQDEEVRKIVQAKIQEKEEERIRQEEQRRIEEEKRAEEERRRLEELAKPSNMFYNLANQKQHKWIANSILRGMETDYDDDRRGYFPYKVFLFFYPSSKTSGLVTVIYFTDNYKEYSTSFMCRVPYIIQDDIIIFTAKYRPWRDTRAEEFMLKILPTDCERLLRVNANTPQMFEMITNDMEDPSWRYRL